MAQWFRAPNALAKDWRWSFVLDRYMAALNRLLFQYKGIQYCHLTSAGTTNALAHVKKKHFYTLNNDSIIKKE